MPTKSTVGQLNFPDFHLVRICDIRRKHLFCVLFSAVGVLGAVFCWLLASFHTSRAQLHHFHANRDSERETHACLKSLQVVKGNADSDEEFEVLDVRGMAKSGKNGAKWLEKYFGEITKASAAKQVTVGGLSGWIAGFAFTKVGRLAALSIGGSLLVVQLATHKGYIKVNWTKVNREVSKVKTKLENEASRRLPWILEEVEDFVKDNVFLATGFAGGFLLGIASS